MNCITVLLDDQKQDWQFGEIKGYQMKSLVVIGGVEYDVINHKEVFESYTSTYGRMGGGSMVFGGPCAVIGKTENNRVEVESLVVFGPGSFEALHVSKLELGFGPRARRR
jgi:hypothetical protein